MNSSSSNRIVIGVVLAVVFGAGVYFYGFRGAAQTQVARVAPAPLPPPALPPAPVPASAPAASSPADQVVSEEGQVTPPAAGTTAPDVAQNDSSTSPAETPAPSKYRIRHTTAANDAPLPVASTEAPTEAPAPKPANPDAIAAASNPSVGPAPAIPDSRISADVKTEIATEAPNSNVNVTTTNGAVALAGSVPNENAVNQAKQAALHVEGVKTVDTSGLMVANQ